MSKLIRIRISSGLLLLAFTVTGHTALQVVTTTQDLAAITEAVGGELVQVQSLTPGTRDPHFATAQPSMIHKVFRADLLLVIGADMEIGWLPALLLSARNGRVQPGQPGYLDLSSAVTLLGKVSGPISRDMGDVHASGNPHYWLDPGNGIRMANAIASRLSELDPSHSDTYQQQLKRFIETLNQRLPIWRNTLDFLKGKPVIAYHKSFIYLADAFDFHIVNEIEPKPGIAPGASSLNALITQIQRDNVRLLIMEPYYEQRSAQWLVEKTGIRLAVLPQSVGAQPEINTYIELFDTIVAALKKSGEQ